MHGLYLEIGRDQLAPFVATLAAFDDRPARARLFQCVELTADGSGAPLRLGFVRDVVRAVRPAMVDLALGKPDAAVWWSVGRYQHAIQPIG